MVLLARRLITVTIASSVFMLGLATMQSGQIPRLKDPFGLPCGRPYDTDIALRYPGVHAWKLFLYLNLPIRTGHSGEPDLKQPLGTVGYPSVWQSWKNAEDVFLPKGAAPASWDTPPSRTSWRSASKFVSLLRLQNNHEIAVSGRGSETIQNLLAISSAAVNTAPSGTKKTPPHQFHETLMNRATFQYILNPCSDGKHELYTVEGQEEMRSSLAGSHHKVQFPQGSMEVKAEWLPLKGGGINGTNLDETRYITKNVNGVSFGLAGLHIMSKDLPDWFWCTFEHVDNPPPVVSDQKLEDIGCGNDEFMDNPEYKPPYGGIFDADTNWPRRVPKILSKSKLRFYRLRGVQTGFTDSTGNPTVLGSTLIETQWQSSSSCISCHARASIGDRPAIAETFPPADRLSPIRHVSDPDQREGLVIECWLGTPDPKEFWDDGAKSMYTQLDYVWSMFRAYRKDEPERKD